MPVDDEVDLVVNVPGGPGEEAAHGLRLDLLGEDLEVHLVAGVDLSRRTVLGGADDRRPPLLTPDAAGDLVRVGTGLVTGEHFDVLLLRLGADRRPGRLVPVADRLPDCRLRGLEQDPVIRRTAALHPAVGPPFAPTSCPRQRAAVSAWPSATRPPPDSA